MQADLVILGAPVYKIHLPDKERLTQDIDFAIALDLDDFEELCNEPRSSEWEQVLIATPLAQSTWVHCWICSPLARPVIRGTPVDRREFYEVRKICGKRRSSNV
jgi:predicted nucleotidyltransferase